MTEFTPFASAIGGTMIGLSAALLLWSHGKIAGISGIVGGLLGRPRAGDTSWRVSFVAGLVLTGVVASLLSPGSMQVGIERTVGALAVAGLLVGFGTRLGSGCTSGHGVCGISRLSVRSVIATLLFTVFGAAVVYVVQHVLGGRL